MPPSDRTANGTPDRTRTCNRRLRRPMLYPVELRAHRQPHCHRFRRRDAAPVPPAARADGRGRGIRTPDILLPKQARYQTALYPVQSVSAPRRPRKKDRRWYEAASFASIRKPCDAIPAHRDCRTPAETKRVPKHPSSTSGAPGEIRTPDHQVRSLVLYPAELRAHCNLCSVAERRSPSIAPRRTRPKQHRKARDYSDRDAVRQPFSATFVAIGESLRRSCSFSAQRRSIATAPGRLHRPASRGRPRFPRRMTDPGAPHEGAGAHPVRDRDVESRRGLVARRVGSYSGLPQRTWNGARAS